VSSFAKTPAPAVPENQQMRAALATRPWLRRLVDAVRPPLPYDLHGRRVGQQRFEAELGPRQSVRVLDLGSGEGREDQLPGLSANTRARIMCADLKPGVDVDFVSDAHFIPLRDNCLDGVVLQGVVEHVPRPWVIAQEIVRVLKPGGVVYCEAPFVQWYHDDPGDYYRFTEAGLIEMFKPCECVESGVAIGPVGAVVGVARELPAMMFTSPYVYWPLKWALSWLTYPLVALDILYRGRPRSKTVALGVYLVGRKPAKVPA